MSDLTAWGLLFGENPFTAAKAASVKTSCALTILNFVDFAKVNETTREVTVADDTT